MLSPFFFSFRVGALLNKSEFFSSKLRVQKLFSYIIRGICDSLVSFRKLEFFPVFPLRALLRKMVIGIVKRYGLLDLLSF